MTPSFNALDQVGMVATLAPPAQLHQNIAKVPDAGRLLVLVEKGEILARAWLDTTSSAPWSASRRRWSRPMAEWTLPRPPSNDGEGTASAYHGGTERL